MKRIYHLFILLCMFISTPSSLVKAHSQDLSQLVNETIQAYQIDPAHLAIAIYDFQSDTHYYLNERQPIYGASTTKVATAKFYVDLIQTGELDWASEIPYTALAFQEGNGNITNSSKQISYPLNDLIYEMLYNSDNTAWGILLHYYYQEYGDYQADLIEQHLTYSPTQVELAQLSEENVINALILETLLIELASDPNYRPILDIMLTAQDNRLLKTYVHEGMATKYGYYDNVYHDIGIYYDKEQPIYAIVVLTQDAQIDRLGIADEFMGNLNLKLNQWEHQTHLVNKSPKTITEGYFQ